MYAQETYFYAFWVRGGYIYTGVDSYVISRLRVIKTTLSLRFLFYVCKSVSMTSSFPPSISPINIYVEDLDWNSQPCSCGVFSTGEALWTERLGVRISQLFLPGAPFSKQKRKIATHSTWCGMLNIEFLHLTTYCLFVKAGGGVDKQKNWIEFHAMN